MADLGEMKVKVSADIADLQKKMDLAGGSVAKATDKFKPLIAGSNSAGFALTNLGRVAQDLPFGFIGIQNNLNPLLESFQRLKAETGSSSLAFKALASSLAGPAGIGFALSLVSSAIVIFQNGIAGFNKKTKEAKDALDEYAKAAHNSAIETEKQKANIEALVSVAKSDVSTKGQQADALRELNKLIPDNIGVLTTQNIKTQEGTVILAAYTKALEAKALAELLSGRIAELSVKRLDEGNAFRTKLIDNLREQAKEQQRLNSVDKTASATERSKEGFALRQQEGYSKLNKLRQQQISLENDYRSTVTETSGTIQRYRGEIEKATAASLDLTDPKGGKVGGKTKADIESISDVLAKLERQIGIISQEELIFNVDKTKEKISAVESSINHLVDKFKLTASSPLILNLEGRIQLFKLDQWAKDVLDGKNITPFQVPFEILFENSPTNEAVIERAKKSLQDQIGQGFGNQIEAPQLGLSNLLNESDFDRLKQLLYLKGLGITKGLQDGLNIGVEGLRFPQLNALVRSTEEKLAAFQNAFQGTFETIGADSFAGLGDALGAALSGNDFSGIFDDLMIAVGSQIQTLGKFLIQSGIQIKIAKEVFKKLLANPVAAVAVGVGLVALGALIKKSIGQKVPGFATGVQNFRGGLAVVGERGPELVNLPQGSDVIPNHALNSMNIGGGQNIQVEVFGRLRGQDIYVSNSRTKSAISRIG